MLNLTLAERERIARANGDDELAAILAAPARRHDEAPHETMNAFLADLAFHARDKRREEART